MNKGSWLPEEEEELKGLSADFFDDLDLPLEEEDMGTATDEEEEEEEEEGDWVVKFENLLPPPLDVLTSFSSEFSSNRQQQRQRRGGGGGVQRKLPVPTLKKQSSSSEVSSTIDDVKVSTLLFSGANGEAFPVKGTRSNLRKRPSPPTFRSLKSFASEMVQQQLDDDDHDDDDDEEDDSSSSAKKKRRQRKKNKSSDTVRTCTHCETTKTPQWREGPCGPKTLCNACGVRFRSGRLLPEYRPSSSPSFVPSLHSNSHRKIIEMMRMKER